MGIFKHEDMLMDSSISSRTKLYKGDKLVFIGDGYKAITMMLNNCKDPNPVKDKFWAQLNMREKPRFSKGDDLEALRKEALDEHARNLEKNKKKSKKRY